MMLHMFVMVALDGRYDYLNEENEDEDEDAIE